MIVPIIICPQWHLKCPPYAPSLLKSILKRESFDAVCFDFNVKFFKYVSSRLKRRNNFSWEDSDYNRDMIKENSEIVDKYVHEIIKLDSPVVSFSVNCQNVLFSNEIARRIKDIDGDKIIIYGGPECFRSEVGSDFLSKPYVDAVCLGEGEIDFVNMLKIIEKNSKPGFCPGFAYKDEKKAVVDCGEGNIPYDLDELPFADFTDFNISEYKAFNRKKVLPILSSKGCVNRCRFCSESRKMKRFRNRSAKEVFQEMKYQKSEHPEVEEFAFADSLINGNILMLDELGELLIKNNMNVEWNGQVTVREEMNKKFLKKLKRAGLRDLSYGVESGSDKILKLMGKKYSSALAEKVLKATYEAGVDFGINIIVGFPGETEVEFQQTVDFLKRNLKYTHSVNLNMFVPVRNTGLCKNPKKYGFSFKPCSELKWKSLDNKNNYRERMRRKRILEEIIYSSSRKVFY